jgi:hypothetical protein
LGVLTVFFAFIGKNCFCISLLPLNPAFFDHGLLAHISLVQYLNMAAESSGEKLLLLFFLQEAQG